VWACSIFRRAVRECGGAPTDAGGEALRLSTSFLACVRQGTKDLLRLQHGMRAGEEAGHMTFERCSSLYEAVRVRG